MFIDIELFSDDPIDNVLSCLKFKFDKVIFLGPHDENIDRVSREIVSRFLKSDRIGIAEVQYINILDNNYEEIKSKLSQVVFEERSAGNHCYLDLTGGDEVVLAAVGSVAAEINIPMHEIDIEEDIVHVISQEEQYSMLVQRNVYMTIEEYLNLHEATIDWGRHKFQNEKDFSKEYKEKINRIYRLSSAMGSRWNRVAIGLAKLCSGQFGYMVFSVATMTSAAQTGGIKTSIFVKELTQMHKRGYLKTFYHDSHTVRLEFFNEEDRSLFCDPGAILEQYACYKVSEDSEVNDYMIGCHINWESEGNPLHYDIYNDDVINEVDVVYMKKNIPTFISCKNKHVSDNKTLYELDAVANRFGGEKVRKVLFAKDGVSIALQNRADEMGIRVVTDL